MGLDGPGRGSVPGGRLDCAGVPDALQCRPLPGNPPCGIPPSRRSSAVEQLIRNQQVAGSIPAVGSKITCLVSATTHWPSQERAAHRYYIGTTSPAAESPEEFRRRNSGKRVRLEEEQAGTAPVGHEGSQEWGRLRQRRRAALPSPTTKGLVREGLRQRDRGRLPSPLRLRLDEAVAVGERIILLGYLLESLHSLADRHATAVTLRPAHHAGEGMVLLAISLRAPQRPLIA